MPKRKAVPYVRPLSVAAVACLRRLLGDYAWYKTNSGLTAHPVSQKKPYPWGLYDVHGNVYELCQNWYGSYPDSAVTDPTGSSSGSYRGGSWLSSARFCHSAGRNWYTPGLRDYNLGFRVLRSSIK